MWLGFLGWPQLLAIAVTAAGVYALSYPDSDHVGWPVLFFSATIAMTKGENLPKETEIEEKLRFLKPGRLYWMGYVTFLSAAFGTLAVMVLRNGADLNWAMQTGMLILIGSGLICTYLFIVERLRARSSRNE